MATRFLEHLRVAFLRRLVRCSDAFVLRGGMRVRQLVSGPRVVRDLDLIYTGMGDPAEVLRQALELDVDDGVAFLRSRFDAYAPNSAHSGLRMIALGSSSEETADVFVDVVWGLELLNPRSTWFEDVRIRAVSPSTIVATKLSVMNELASQWRPKDLSDVLRLLRTPIERDRLGEALEHFWDGRVCWDRGIARWNEHRRALEMPRLDDAIDELRGRLTPFGRLR